MRIGVFGLWSCAGLATVIAAACVRTDGYPSKASGQITEVTTRLNWEKFKLSPIIT